MWTTEDGHPASGIPLAENLTMGDFVMTEQEQKCYKLGKFVRTLGAILLPALIAAVAIGGPAFGIYNMEKNYSVGCICPNCNNKMSVSIPKGTLIEDFEKGRCSVCKAPVPDIREHLVKKEP